MVREHVSVQVAVGEGREGGGDLLSARSRLCQDWIVVVVVVNRDQHAGTLTLRYLSGVISGRLMKGTEKRTLSTCSLSTCDLFT